jgi:hypothetical protein
MIMRNYEIEQEMYRRAVELIEKRYPIGWGGAGVVHTANGHYYTSVCIETANASAELCIETFLGNLNCGTRSLAVVHTACVYALDMLRGYAQYLHAAILLNRTYGNNYVG